MIFDEIYSRYFRTIDKVIEIAIVGDLNKEKLRAIVNQNAFLESSFFIEEEIDSQNWNLITSDFKTPIKRKPSKQVTILQQRFLKTISMDKRFKLFSDIDFYYDVEPLFNSDDIIYFDKYHNGDDYDDPKYIENFRLLLDITKSSKAARITFISRKGKETTVLAYPKKIEYSQKMDAFKLVTNKYLININSITKINVVDKTNATDYKPKKSKVVVEIYDKRKALERCMIEFSVFEKTTERIDDETYRMNLTYYSEDETEIVIRLLAFGPYIKVLSPESFVNQIKERLYRQQTLK